MASQKSTVVAHTFYLIRSRDVELAEDFLRRCPRDIRSIRELNAFFHRILAQYPCDTFHLRVKLVDDKDFAAWAGVFVNDILPFIRLNRFPANTSQRAASYYSDLTSLAQRGFAAIAG